MAFFNANAINVNLLDSHSYTTLKLGPYNVSKVEIANSTTLAEIMGLFTVKGVPTFDMRYFSAYSTDTIDVSAGMSDLTLGTETRKDSIFTHTTNSAEILCSTAGDYEISYTIATNNTSGSERSLSEAAIFRKPNAGAYAEVAGTRVYMYNRLSPLGYGSGTCQTVLTIAANDTLKIQVARVSGTSTVSTISGGSRILVKKL